jgi:hypothetical protein
MELSLSSDTEFSYEIRSISLEEYSNPQDDASLKEEILRCKPGLIEMLEKDRLQAIAEISDWVSNTVDWGNTNREAGYFHNNPAHIIYYDRILKDRGGDTCGGFSIFLKKVLKIFGIDSFEINFGIREYGLTHVVVIVPIKEGKHYDFYIIDPFFNGYFTNNENRFISFKYLIDTYRADPTRIKLKSFPMKRDWVMSKEDFENQKSYIEQIGDLQLCVPCENIVVCKEVHIENYLFLCLGWRQILTDLKINPDDFYLNLLTYKILGIGSCGDTAARNEYIKMLKDLDLAGPSNL